MGLGRSFCCREILTVWKRLNIDVYLHWYIRVHIPLENMFHFVKKVALLYGLLWVTYQTVAQENRLTCGRRKVKSAYLIHNGIDAKAGHWPWHAAIFHRKGEQNEYACGGAVIDENTILTGK